MGYDRHDPAGVYGENSHNDTRTKMLTDVGPVPLDVPRDREGSFEPQLVKRRLHRVGEMVLSLTMTTGEVSAHLPEVHGTRVSCETVSKVTDALGDEMGEWLNRPLEQVYAAVCIDALVVKLRDRQVTNRPAYCAIGVTADGTRDILGSWIGMGRVDTKFWLQVVTEIKNRDTEDVCIVVCDGLEGLPESIEATWTLPVIQTCVLHLIRNTSRLARQRNPDKMSTDLQPVYTAPSEQAPKKWLSEVRELCGERYPTIHGLWDNAWAELVPFLDYSPEIRRLIYSTNAIESFNARMKRAICPRGHFRNDQATLKCLYMIVRSLDQTGRRWMNRSSPHLNSFAITFEGRLMPTVDR